MSASSLIVLEGCGEGFLKQEMYIGCFKAGKSHSDVFFYKVSLFKYCFLKCNQTVSALSVRFTRQSKRNKTSESLTAFLINIRSETWGELERKGECNVTLKKQHKLLKKKNLLNQYCSPQEFNRGLLRNLLKKSRFVQSIAWCRYMTFLQSQKLWNFYYNQKIQEINK